MDVRVGEGPLAFEILVKCLRCDREQVIRWWGNGVVGTEVKLQAGLIDGSELTPPPGPESPLCKCGICGGELLSKVTDMRTQQQRPQASAPAREPLVALFPGRGSSG